MLFQPRENPFLCVPRALSSQVYSPTVGGSEKSQCVGDEMRMQTGDGQSYCRCSKWPPLATT